ncbi:MAG: beta-galactosidase [Lachnospiraceae bacterium]|nr:beta-galactosidase [Lachnospiraceae bacterium]
METVRFIIPSEPAWYRTDLPVGGKDAARNEYTADGRSLKLNGRRILPVMGEFHFSRFEPEFWREELLKMKAGGIDIAATYLFWIHHEERKGEWDFSGCRDIRRFVLTCGECGMMLWLRIGPWVHGECRNGGFPDWLEHDNSFEKRVNDPEYLELVKTWYGKIYRQVQGLFIKDGGPILGVQIENEYGHCGGPKDRKLQAAHMKKLYTLAREAGFVVPYYTATAWGGACTIDETLQVLSGYVDAPWDNGIEKLPPKDNFRFIPYFDDAETGSDFETGDGEAAGGTVRRDYPYLTAELGGGLQVTSHRRPVASSKDNEAAVLTALGAGANLIGYYMYHGGINPEGKCSPLNESQDSGGHTNTPVKSYDFDACLNEAGKAQESFGGLKKYAHFLHCFGEDLAGTEVILPEERPKTAADLHMLRAALRLNRESGNAYLFVNNHQRGYELDSHPSAAVRIEFPDGGSRCFSDLVFRAGECCLYRFNLYDGDNGLIRANALCELGERRFYWLDGTDDSTEEGAAEFAGRKEKLPAGPGIAVLSERAANRAFLYEDGLYITENADSILIEDGGVKKLLTAHKKETLTVYRPDGSVENIPVRTGKASAGGKQAAAQVSYCCVKEQPDGKGGILFRDYTVRISRMPEAHRLFLRTDCRGDRAELYLNGKLADDWFTTGKPWYILLDRFGRPETLTIRIYDSLHPLPCSFSEKVYYDLPKEDGCGITGMEICCEYLCEV